MQQYIDFEVSKFSLEYNLENFGFFGFMAIRQNSKFNWKFISVRFVIGI